MPEASFKQLLNDIEIVELTIVKKVRGLEEEMQNVWEMKNF